MFCFSEAQVNHYEEKPGTIPTELLVRAQALRTDIASLIANTIPLPSVDADSPYVQMRYDLDLLKQYIDDAPALGEFNIPNQPPTPDDVRKQLERYHQKPNLVLVGRFDSGKSHLALLR